MIEKELQVYSDNNLANPYIQSPLAPFGVYFLSLKSSMGMDATILKKFINSCKSMFRSSSFYKNYKSHLYNIGLDRCQVFSNINVNDESAKIEMHHNALKLEDLIIIITNHILNTQGFCTTFDVISELKRVHKEYKVPIVMLSKTIHQLADNDMNYILPSQMCFGFWELFVSEFSRGITPAIAKKLFIFIKKSAEYDDVENVSESLTNDLDVLKENIKGWSEYNEYSGVLDVSELYISSGDNYTEYDS